MKDKLILSAAGILYAVLLILPAVWIGYHFGKGAESSTGQVQGREQKSDPREGLEAPAPQPTTGGAITIPGFERVKLAATQEQQAAPFYNPEGNNCYFVVSLLLSDGEEIYRSGLVAPGEAVPSITLSHVPAVGTYQHALLRYSCYSMAEFRAINGADVELTLEIT